MARKRIDGILLVGMACGALLWLGLAGEVSLTPTSPLAFEPGELEEVARWHATRAGAPTGAIERAYFSAYREGEIYLFVAKRHGDSAARALIRESLPLFAGVVEWANGVRVVVDTDGRLLSLQLAGSSVPHEGEPRANETKGIRRERLETLFGIDPSTLRAEEGRRFAWRDPESHFGIVTSYEARFENGALASASRRFETPEEEGIDWELRALQESPLAILTLWFAVAGWRERRSALPFSRWRLATAFLQFVIGVWICWLAFHLIAGPKLTWLSSILIGLGAGLCWIVVSIAMEHRLRVLGPGKLATLTRLFEGRISRFELAVVVLRGTCVGFILLGLDTLLVWLGTRAGLFWFDPIPHLVIPSQLILSNPLPSLHVAVFATYQALLVTLAVGLVLPALALRPGGCWRILLIGSALVALLIQNPAISMAAILPNGWKLLLLFIAMAVLCWTLLRFDLLTVAVAVFTFAFVWGNAQQWWFHGSVAASGPSIGFVLWGTCVAVAAVGAVLQQRSDRSRASRERPHASESF